MNLTCWLPSIPREVQPFLGVVFPPGLSKRRRSSHPLSDRVLLVQEEWRIVMVVAYLRLQ